MTLPLKRYNLQIKISALHQAALDYAASGIAVFPCLPNGKVPACKNGFKDATLDLEQINKWWGENENYNLAFSPGMAGLTVVDLDPGYELSGVLPDTYSIKTPRGFHHYFIGASPSSASKIGLHCDTRSEGGYVLLPPSIVLGREYILNNDVAYAPLPDWIIKALEEPEIIRQAEVEELDLNVNIQRAEDWLGTIIGAEQGHGGDEYTYKVCCRLRDFGISELKAFEVLETWNNRCNPPWGADELQNKIHNAYSYAQNEPGNLAIESSEMAFGDTVAKLNPVKQSRFLFKTEKEFENEPEPKWIIKDLISERSTALLYAPPSSYKSFIALDVALSTSSGNICFGETPVVGPVFYAALEGRSHLRKAIRAWKIAKQANKIDNFYLGRAPLIGIDSEIQEFGNEIKKKCAAPKLIIIDTLSKSMAGLNENDAKDAGRFIQFCDSLVEAFHCSVLAIHHTGKDKDRGARGSSAFLAGFDTVIEINAHKATKAVSVSVKKHKDAEERETPWTFEGRAIGGSLVFFETSPEVHAVLTHAEKEFSSKKIGAALKKIGAKGASMGVSDSVLASELTPLIENQGYEEREQAISVTLRALRANKDNLSGYFETVGNIRKWSLPD